MPAIYNIARNATSNPRAHTRLITPDPARPSFEEAEFLAWLERDCGYVYVRKLPGFDRDKRARWAGLYYFTHSDAVIAGAIGLRGGYAHRWDYPTRADARQALEAWTQAGGKGAPPWLTTRLTTRGRRVAFM